MINDMQNVYQISTDRENLVVEKPMFQKALFSDYLIREMR